jgi:hypothetical protein
MRKVIAWLLVALCAGTARGQAVAAAAQAQTETDEYTRYELLAPESASFAIHYEVTATTTGAKYYFNPIRKGSVASGESVTDAMTGQPLRFEVVSGEESVKDPLMKGAPSSVDYIKVYLARPVPPEGQTRLLILKTYKDAKSYYREGDAIVFNRSLGIPRNSVVLPAGYELVACNVASQVLAEPDGRIAVSFMNGSGSEAPLVVKARLGAQTGTAAAPRTPGSAKSWEAPFAGETEKERLAERAHQDREIVYFLQQPETHAFSLYHNYRVARGRRQIFQRSTWRQQSFGAFGLRARHRRKAGDTINDRSGTGSREGGSGRAGRRGGASGGDSLLRGEGRAVRALANFGDVYGAGELSPRGR